METKKRLTREQKWEQAVVDLINQMFIIAGHDVTYNDVLGKEKWFMEYSMTVEQSEEFREWGIKYLREKLKINKKQAEREIMWFNVQWGLTYSNWEEYHKTNLES
jgi:predicted KAP-like P-loop ATPase